MAATMNQVRDRWLEECGRDDPHYLHRSDGSLFVTKEGILYYDREGRGSWGRGRPARNITLGQFIGSRWNGGFVLLNGDGLEDPGAMDWQTRIRELCQGKFGTEKCAIIPYSALNAAELVLDSIRPIEVTQDRFDTVPVYYRGYTAFLDDLLKVVHNRDQWPTGWQVQDGSYDPSKIGAATWPTGRLEGLFNGNRMLVEFSNPSYKPTGYEVRLAWVWAQPENGRPSWQALAKALDPEAQDAAYEWQWAQQIHRLGAVVFSAKDREGSRSRWLSAFDTQEREPMYFLAMLPSKGTVSGYNDAINLLAPPMVHAAKAKGIPVHRQGDVFAIETEMTDEYVYSVAKTRVRMEIAMQDPEQMYRSAARSMPKPPAEGEPVDVIPCPHCNGTMEAGCGPSAKKALMILGTGHTASEVVITEDGRTFIRGSMFHRPVLETPGRLPEHVDVPLSDSKRWYLCIRNTVPRQKSRTARPASARRRPFIEFAAANRADNQTTRAAWLDLSLPARFLPPQGFEWTGEFRRPEEGDWWLPIRSRPTDTNRGMKQMGVDSPPNATYGRERHILRLARATAERQVA